MARSIDWHWFKQFLTHMDDVHLIQTFEDFYCFRMYTSIQHWSCFDLWVAKFLHMLLDFFESALFSVKLPSWDLAWMLWQKFLDICLCKNPLAKFRAAELSCIFQTFLNSWALLISLKSWFCWKPNIIISVQSAECELSRNSDT